MHPERRDDSIKRLTLGVIGSGMLGAAIAEGLLAAGLPSGQLWMANRSGKAPALHGAVPRMTRDVQALCNACDAVILCVPPAALGDLRFAAPDTPVISTVAGLTLAGLIKVSGSNRAIRAMSSPAAARQLAYSPWVAAAGTDQAARDVARVVLSALGAQDELKDEGLIDHFTAITGPVPGFVALFADCMVAHAVAQGVPEAVAVRAIRQLFLASGELLAGDPATPGAQVREMIDYGGTTAAGMAAMQDGDLARIISDGLSAAAARARDIA